MPYTLYSLFEMVDNKPLESYVMIRCNGQTIYLQVSKIADFEKANNINYYCYKIEGDWYYCVELPYNFERGYV